MTDKVSVSLTSMTLVYQYISFNFMGFITVLGNDGSLGRFRGGNLESPKAWGHRSHPWCSMVRGSGWKICPEKTMWIWNFELPCYWQRHRWTPSCCHRYRASWWNQNHWTPKKCGTTKNHKGKIFWSKKASLNVWKLCSWIPGSRISTKIISISIDRATRRWRCLGVMWFMWSWRSSWKRTWQSGSPVIWISFAGLLLT